MQEDEDLELRDKGRAWEGELSDSDSEDHDLRRRNQGVIASEAAFARLVPPHPRCKGLDVIVNLNTLQGKFCIE